ncbi:MAG: secretin N-terminal domain-containing protein [Planctomycetota bacterium]
MRILALCAIVSLSVAAPARAQEEATESPAVAEENQPSIDATPVEADETPVDIESPSDSTPAAADVSPDEAAEILLSQLEPRLRLNFEGASWQNVLTWLAEQADLSLQVDRYPPGSVNLADSSQSYTLNGAMDELNRLLLDRGYALVRRGRMLFVVDLERENADRYISEMAELVSPEELEYRGKSDIVSTVFPLGSMTPAEAKEQLPQLVGPWGRVIVLDSARQAKVTERADKLLAIREVISKSEQQVIEIKLSHRSAEELLQTARPLLELEPGENSNDDIRIAVGLYGERIFATGLPSKISVLQSLIQKADQPIDGLGEAETAEVARPGFQTHAVRVADLTTVYDVLGTMLQDEPNTRVSIDPTTQSIIALATPETHQMITDVIAKMEGSGDDFQVFQLKRIDPAQALLTINKYFGTTEEDAVGPVVDGDPATGKLWVRGSKDEIAQVERLLEQLDGGGSSGLLRGKVRLLDMTGQQAEEVLGQLQFYWQMTGRENRIRLITPGGRSRGSDNGIRERQLYRPKSNAIEPPSPAPTADLDASSFDVRRFHYLTQAPAPATPADAPKADSSSAAAGNPPGLRLNSDILIEITPQGQLRIASDDTEALDDLEELISQLAGPTNVQSDLPTIFWLKYIKAEVAAELIASVLGGSDSSSSLTDTITGGLGGGMLGGMMGLMGGGGGGEASSAKSILTTTGSVNIVPDARLNALLIQANEIDLQLIQMVLEKVDREESPEDIELTSFPRLIPVLYQNADDVAKVVKEVFAEQMGGNERAQAGGRGGQPSPQDFLAAIRGGRGRGGDDGAKSERSKIIVSVDSQSNSLVVTATTQDFEKIRLLVEALDEGGKQTQDETVIVTLPGGINNDNVVEALQAVLGQKIETASSSSSDSNNGRSNATPGANADAAAEMRSRIEAFRARFGGGLGGRGGAGGGSPFGGRGGGGGPGGGGGRPGGGGGRPGGGGR